jgi:hypothetical protein
MFAVLATLALAVVGVVALPQPASAAAFSIDTADGTAQFWKGFFKWAIHVGFLIAAVTYLGRRGERFYWRTLGVFTAGVVVNCIYGVLQLVSAQGGRNLDDAVLKPITGGASSINIYGAVEGQSVYRPNALTADPNHLGIMILVPLLTLLPVYLRLPKGHRLRPQLAVVLAFFLIVELATLSRSGLLGLGCGLLVLAIPYRRRLLSRDLLVPLLLLPLLVPVMIAAAGASQELLAAGGPSFHGVAKWLAVLAFYDMTFAAVGFAVYDYLLED